MTNTSKDQLLRDQCENEIIQLEEDLRSNLSNNLCWKKSRKKHVDLSENSKNRITKTNEFFNT